jgi:two-component system KDP operon response regulator KdpE
MMNATILVVDDEPQIQRFLRHALEATGYVVRLADRGEEAVRAMAGARPPDLIVLDLGLPDGDGKLALARLRQRSDVPVIVLSARDDEAEKIAALDLGANDYVEKPFGVGEFLARVRVLLRARQSGAADADRLTLGPIVLDRAAHRVTIAGEAVRLTPKEFDLLLCLASHPGRVMTHRQILSQVWGPAHTEDVAYLRVFIGQLRQKIEADPADPKIIQTELGIGYRACADET